MRMTNAAPTKGPIGWRSPPITAMTSTSTACPTSTVPGIRARFMLMYLAGSVLAAQMAVEDFGGKVLGAPIEVISGDHQNKPDVGAGIARQWIDADHVDAIVDVPTSSVALAVQDVTREKKRIFLMSGPASSDLTGKARSPYGIQWTYDTYALAQEPVGLS